MHSTSATPFSLMPSGQVSHIRNQGVIYHFYKLLEGTECSSNVDKSQCLFSTIHDSRGYTIEVIPFVNSSCRLSTLGCIQTMQCCGTRSTGGKQVIFVNSSSPWSVLMCMNVSSVKQDSPETIISKSPFNSYLRYIVGVTLPWNYRLKQYSSCSRLPPNKRC